MMVVVPPIISKVREDGIKTTNMVSTGKWSVGRRRNCIYSRLRPGPGSIAWPASPATRLWSSPVPLWLPMVHNYSQIEHLLGQSQPEGVLWLDFLLSLVAIKRFLLARLSIYTYCVSILCFSLKLLTCPHNWLTGKKPSLEEDAALSEQMGSSSATDLVEAVLAASTALVLDFVYPPKKTFIQHCILKVHLKGDKPLPTTINRLLNQLY